MIGIKGLWVSMTAVALVIGLTACPNRRPAQEADSSAEAAQADAPGAESKAKASRRSHRDRTPHESSGQIAFPEKEHDFGEVEEGEKLSHVFKVRNEHEEEVLHIKRVRGS